MTMLSKLLEAPPPATPRLLSGRACYLGFDQAQTLWATPEGIEWGSDEHGRAVVSIPWADLRRVVYREAAVEGKMSVAFVTGLFDFVFEVELTEGRRPVDGAHRRPALRPPSPSGLVASS